MPDQEREVHLVVQDANTGRSWTERDNPDYKVMLYLSIANETQLPGDATMISCRLNVRVAEQLAYGILREVSLIQSSIEDQSKKDQG